MLSVPHVGGSLNYDAADKSISCSLSVPASSNSYAPSYVQTNYVFGPISLMPYLLSGQTQVVLHYSQSGAPSGIIRVWLYEYNHDVESNTTNWYKGNSGWFEPNANADAAASGSGNLASGEIKLDISGLDSGYYLVLEFYASKQTNGGTLKFKMWQ